MECTRENLIKLFTCIDHTTLNATDTESTVEVFCRDILDMSERVGEAPAAVCVYPPYVKIAAQTLRGSGIAVASVACGFPSAQMPVSLKLDEVRYVLENGATEVDMVISRGYIVDGELTKAYDEIAAVRELCIKQKLKVILETGELKTEANISAAAQTAIAAGADFIKTSTGKIPTGATIEAAEIMLKILTNCNEFSGKPMGFKASGGISTVEQAMEYADLVGLLRGHQYVNKQYFRIGASRLTEKLVQLLAEKN